MCRKPGRADRRVEERVTRDKPPIRACERRKPIGGRGANRGDEVRKPEPDAAQERDRVRAVDRVRDP